MKTKIYAGLAIGIITIFTLGLFVFGGVSKTTNKSLDHISITPIEHASFMIEWNGTRIAVDPTGSSRQYENTGVVDMVLVTDTDTENLSTSTLQGLDTDNSVLVVPQAVIESLGGSVYFGDIEVMDNGETEELLDFKVTAVAMYNVPETEDALHPKGRGNGYVIEKDGVRLYVAGDTGNHRLIRGLKDIDIAFIPMSEPYTMPVKEAVEAVLAFGPRVVYPYSYRGETEFSDTEEFKKLVSEENSEIDVRLENWYPKRELGTSAIQANGIDPEIEEAYQIAAEANTTQAWQDFISQYRDHPLADEARYELQVLRGIK